MTPLLERLVRSGLIKAHLITERVRKSIGAALKKKAPAVAYWPRPFEK